ncbi:MAG: phytoene/squalene synthase family protein [Chthoniobacteraceae bacterium]
MTEDDVTGDLLKSVSRSFYLSVRVLPPALREAMGVAYLLARISDTIADSEGAPIATRLRRLTDFGAMLQAGANFKATGAIQQDIHPAHEGERTLIAAIPRVLERFGTFEPWLWRETQELLSNIIRGQTNDLRAFLDPEHVTALPDAASLEDYIYLVAGCVGEWWTCVCFHHFPKYSRRSEDEMTALASGFGKGLQLVNILRDMPADLRAGRCYLPGDELQAAGIDSGRLAEEPAAAQPVFERWLARARAYVEKGREYISVVRPWRLRIACYLPWRLAVRTLDMIEKNPPLRTREKVKVSRGEVYGAMMRSMVVAFSNQPLR